MTATAHVFPQFFEGVRAGNITLPGSGWKVALGNAAGPITLATSGISTAKLFTDWTAIVTEIAGTGYTAGGLAIASPTYTFGTPTWTFTTATNPQWTTATLTANQAVVYQSTATTFQLAAFWDFGGAVSSTASTYTLTISGSGILTATAS